MEASTIIRLSRDELITRIADNVPNAAADPAIIKPIGFMTDIPGFESFLQL